MFDPMGWLHFRKTRLRKWVVLCALVWSTSHVAAINIVLNFDATQSESPTFDPTGALLQPLFQHVETFYQDVFEDTAANTTLTINYWYEDLVGTQAGFIGHHALATETTSGGTLPNRETEANIRIDTLVGTGGAERNWFIDTTPADDDEFTMGQTLWRDLTVAQRTNLFNFGADIPDTFETGYSGNAVTGSAAVGVRDMLSVVLHEVGHALGMSAGNTATVAETSDGDYDFNPDFVFGRTLAAKVDNGCDCHLDTGGLFVMDPSTAPVGTRRQPSHADLFAMAAGHSYTDLDVPRREFYRPGGGGNWNNSANWSGDEVPGAADDVYVRDNRPGATGNLPTANLTANGTAANLTVAEGGNVDTEGFRLDVVGTITVTDINSDLFIRTGGEAEANTLTVTNDAEVRPETGGLIDVDQLNISDNSLLVGAGEVNVQTELENDGTITASGGTLTVTTTNTGGVFDLDGSFFSREMLGNVTEPGKVNATGGDIVVDGRLTDGFNGTMTVLSTRSITFQDDWELSASTLGSPSNGTLNLTEGTISGPGTMTAQGILNVSAGEETNISYINAPVDFGSEVDVNVYDGAELEVNGAATVQGGTFNINDDGLLDFDGMLSIGSATFNDTSAAGTADVRFDGITTYTGGTIDSTATLAQNTDATVNGATVINGSVVNLDGGGTTTVTLNDDLTINADKLDSDGNKFDGTLNINNPGYLQVATTAGSWTMAGTMNLDQNGQPNTYLVRGDDINITGQVTVTGATAMNAAAHISGTVTLGDPDDLLQFGGGGNTLSGGEIVGPGRLVAVGNTLNNSLTGYGTISADIKFSGSNSDLLADGGTLSVSGEILDVDDIGTAGNTGTLDMANAWNTHTADELRLNGGVVTGGGITNDGTTIGHGAITSSWLVNNSTLTADGGTLTLNTGTFPDLDGSSETGTVNALVGSVEVLTASSGNFAFDGTLNVGAGQMFRSNTRGLTNYGVVNLTNGTVEVADFSQDAQLNVSAGGASRLESPGIDFEWASTSTVEDDLEVVGDTNIFAGAVLTGSGRLVVPAGSFLTLRDGATVGIEIENNGQMSVGSSPGFATIDAFTQTVGGQWEVDLGGTLAGTEHDQLNIINNATLAGMLDVSLIDGFFPTEGDLFDIISADLITGAFDTVNLPALAPDLEWDQSNLYTTGELLVSLSQLLGDFNHDGIINAVDIDLLRLAINTGSADPIYNVNGGGLNDTDFDYEVQNIIGSAFGDADLNKQINFTDYVSLSTNFGSSGTGWAQGNFNLDNNTNFADFVVLANNYGTNLSSGVSAQETVPEPASWVLLSLAVGFVAKRRSVNGR